MYLAKFHIENFRGIRSVDLTFDQESIMIGENDCGKSTILEALALILGSEIESESPQFKLFHFFCLTQGEVAVPVGPIRLALTFVERYLREWSTLDTGALHVVWPKSNEIPNELIFEMWAIPTLDGSDSKAHWKLTVEQSETVLQEDDPKVLEWIRQMSPLIWVRGGAKSGRIDLGRLMGKTGGPIQEGNPEMLDMMGKIDTHYKNVMAGTTTNIQEELQSGYNVAVDLLNKATSIFSGKRGSLHRVVEEVLGDKAVSPQSESHDVLRLHGSAAEKIGVLLFTVALLHSGTRVLHPGAEPIILIEDPEAHLHPMTLMSIMVLIEDIKWQKIITTQSSLLISTVPLFSLRRITRDRGFVKEWKVSPGSISNEDLRRLNYHLRMRHGEATFGRCWLLIEGESETWILPNMARLCGFELQLEGVECVEFAQCGIKPLIRIAEQLGIEWYLLADGDKSGDYYVETARTFLSEGEEESKRITQFHEWDIENFFWSQGYSGVYQHYAEVSQRVSKSIPPKQVIRRAIENRSKPFLAIAVVEAASRDGSPRVPELLRKMITTVVDLAHKKV